MEKATKKEMLLDRSKFHVENLFYMESGKWYVRVTDRRNGVETEFFITSSYLHKILGKSEPYTLVY